MNMAISAKCHAEMNMTAIQRKAPTRERDLQRSVINYHSMWHSLHRLSYSFPHKSFPFIFLLQTTQREGILSPFSLFFLAVENRGFDPRELVAIFFWLDKKFVWMDTFMVSSSYESVIPMEILESRSPSGCFQKRLKSTGCIHSKITHEEESKMEYESMDTVGRYGRWCERSYW